MGSRFLDERTVERYRQFRFDFPERTLAGKVVLIAGATGGLGSATAALLVHEGATVVLGYRTNRARAEALKAALAAYGNGSIGLVEGDLAEPVVRERYLAAAAEQGELYGLVSLMGDPARVPAGENDPKRRSEALEKALQDSWGANFLAPLLLARLAGERMQAAGTPGSIVLFSTMQAVGVFEGSTPYAAPKSALIQAAKILAKELGGKPNIRVNVIAPGATVAGMAEASIRAGKYDEYVAKDIIPRFGRPEDIARAVRFLLEPDSYITGQVLTVDGGLTLRRDLR